MITLYVYSLEDNTHVATMTTKPYSVTLFDCPGLRQADRDKAVDDYCTAIESDLGGADQVSTAYLTYMDAFYRNDGLPLPKEATSEDRAVIERWQGADSAGCAAAFADWYRYPEGAHFEIEFA